MKKNNEGLELIEIDIGYYFVKDEELIFISKDDLNNDIIVTDLTELTLWEFQDLYKNLVYYYNYEIPSRMYLTGNIIDVKVKMYFACTYCKSSLTKNKARIYGVNDTIEIACKNCDDFLYKEINWK